MLEMIVVIMVSLFSKACYTVNDSDADQKRPPHGSKTNIMYEPLYIEPSTTLFAPLQGKEAGTLDSKRILDSYAILIFDNTLRITSISGSSEEKIKDISKLGRSGWTPDCRLPVIHIPGDHYIILRPGYYSIELAYFKNDSLSYRLRGLNLQHHLRASYCYTLKYSVSNIENYLTERNTMDPKIVIMGFRNDWFDIDHLENIYVKGEFQDSSGVKMKYF